MNRLQKMKCSIVSVMILCRGTQDLNVTTCCLLIIANSLHHIKCTNLLLKYISPATFCSWVLSLYDHFSSDEVVSQILFIVRLCDHSQKVALLVDIFASCIKSLEINNRHFTFLSFMKFLIYIPGCSFMQKTLQEDI